MIIDVITILPDMFEGPLSASVIGLARERNLVKIRLHDLRNHTDDRHRTTDDYPYGGGPGMVMKPEPIFRAVRTVQDLEPTRATVIFMTPSGSRFTQKIAGRLSEAERMIVICGRYEGFDERVLTLADIELSIGDYVLTGGELPAMVVIDAVVRLLPEVLGHADSTLEESFSEGLLEYPQYTRPQVFEEMSVPDVLLSGDHARIARYRREQAIAKTALNRPEMLATAELTEAERALAARIIEGGQ